MGHPRRSQLTSRGGQGHRLRLLPVHLPAPQGFRPPLRVDRRGAQAAPVPSRGARGDDAT